MSIQMLAPAPYVTVTTRQGTQYTADVNGMINGLVQSWDMADLLNAGCIVAEQVPDFQYEAAAGHPAVTGSDVVVAVATLPANFFTQAGVGVELAMIGQFANNTNTKTGKIIVGPSTAVIGSAVGSGGTTIATTGAYSTTGAIGFTLNAQVTKIGAAGSNTQVGIQTAIILGTTHGGMGIPAALTLTETSPILIAFTLNAATAVSDATLNYASVQPLD